MIVRLEQLKAICATILAAVDSSELSKLTETLELKSDKNILYLNVTNKEYYAQVKLDMEEEIDFHATVNANLFLNLISQTTAETVELKINETSLEIRGNGKYKLPLIYDDDTLLELPAINIDNVTAEFDIDTEILSSILRYNSKELTKGIISRPVQNLYYIDNEGCITFTSGACVNNFNLEAPVKLLLNNRIVKLFNLFKDSKTHFKLGYDAISEDIIQTKVQFECSNIRITAIVNSSDSLINTVPVAAIRNRANTIYDHAVVFNKEYLLQTINRLLLFVAGYGSKEILKPYSLFRFDNDCVTIFDVNNINSEELYYVNAVNSLSEPYEAILDLVDLKTTLQSYTDEYVNLKFGNHQAVVLTRNNIVNVIPECHNV